MTGPEGEPRVRRGPRLMKQLVATIDERTTIICLDAAGQIRPLDEPFETLNGDFDHPPFHVNCRDIVVPWARGMIDEQRAAANAELQRRPIKHRRKGPNGEIGAPKVPTVQQLAAKRVTRLAKEAEPSPAQIHSTGPARPGRQQARKFVRDEYNAAVTGEADLEDDELAAVDAFVGGGYVELNDILRSGELERLDFTEYPGDVRTFGLAEMLDLMTAAFEKIRTLKPMSLYRALPKGGLTADVKPGDVLHDDGIVSSSFAAYVADRFRPRGARLLLITLDSGAHVLRAKPDDLEFLLPPGTTFRVVEVTDEYVKVVVV